MRIEIADQCNSIYGMSLQPEQVTDCDGCNADTGRLFSGCLRCEIRKCAKLKNLINCAHCSDYACDILEKHFFMDPGARERLKEFRSALKTG